MQNNQFLKVKHSYLELNKYFMELKDWELKDRKEKIKKDVEKLFHKLIVVCKYDISLKKKKMKKIRPVIRNRFDGLIKQNVMRKKPKTIRDKFKDKIINDIWTFWDCKRKRIWKKKEKIIKIK